MKTTKKTLSLILSLAMILCTFVVPAEATYELSRNIDKDSFVTDYPFVFVHGMGGWGPTNSFYETSPYWGGGLGQSDTDLIKILNGQGVETYAAQVGPLNSAWDRACELYAQLMGTVVDYGEAHSKEHGHERYGFSYEESPLMGKPWNPKNKINLVGHSFGGATIRLFTSLMTYGSKEEKQATGKNTSPLFKGGHDSVHACVTLSAPHNGTQVANQLYDVGWPFFLLSMAYNLVGSFFGNNFMVFSLQMSHFDLTPEQEFKRMIFNPLKAYNYYKSDDNCYYDLTVGGARKLNETIKLSKNTYYYSYSTVATETSKITGKQTLIDSATPIFDISAFLMSLGEGGSFDGTKIEGDWIKHDGIVPLASALYPTCDKKTATDYENAVAKGKKIRKGRWYYMDTMVGMDHFDFCGTEDYPTTFDDFYFTMVETVNSR